LALSRSPCACRVSISFHQDGFQRLLFISAALIWCAISVIQLQVVDSIAQFAGGLLDRNLVRVLAGPASRPATVLPVLGDWVGAVLVTRAHFQQARGSVYAFLVEACPARAECFRSFPAAIFDDPGCQSGGLAQLFD